MFIPKNKMPMLVDELDLLLSLEEDRSPEMEELIKQIRDRAVLCLHGDANFLEIDVFYGYKKPKPSV